jgi:type IVB pilus formation R64 PilN family outer membrane protein
MNHLNKLRLTALAASVVMLAGCATVKGIHDSKVAIQKSADDVQAKVNQIENESAAPNAPGVRVFDDQYISTDSVELAKAVDPRLKCKFPYNAGKNGRTLQEIGQDITDKCGIPVHITADAIAAMAGAYDKAIVGQAQNGNQSSSTGVQTAGLSSAPIPSPTGNVVAPPPGSATGSLYDAGYAGMAQFHHANIQIVWDRDLDSFLPALAARTGLSYRMTDGVITFYYLDTQTFDVTGIPSDMTFGTDTQASSATTTGTSGNTGVGGGGGGGSGDNGGGGQSTTTQKVTEVVQVAGMKQLTDVVQSMLTQGIGRVASMFGSMTVTDTPDKLKKIGDLIADRNKRNSLQGLFTLRIYSVQMTRTSEGGFNINALFSNLNKKYGISLVNGFAANGAATTAGINILNSNSKWSGSSAVFDLLSQVANVKTLYDQPITLLNMHSTTYKNIASDMFVSGASTTAIGSSTSGIQSSVQQAIQSVGINVQMLPYITPKGDEVYLQFALDLSSAKPITTQSVAGTTVQQTHTQDTGGVQSVRLQSGQTLMLMGSIQAGDTLTQTGTGDEHFQLLGGGQNAVRNGQYLLIMITPNIQG